MYRKSEDRQREVRHEMRGGVGDVTMLHSFKADELGSPTRVCAEIDIEPGCSIGKHAHDNEEEIFYIISGTATADDDGTERVLHEGDSLLTGNGACHSIKNTGDTTLRVFAVVIKFA